ncbi:hypothetical protein ILYODFUR_038180 [Ilyodon furcidens]|uniref:Uncharacterized protein n=1 Tax=Ilyodon furcidens TaxID=33524 RepID=A0ABV0VL82_9TELE
MALGSGACVQYLRPGWECPFWGIHVRGACGVHGVEIGICWGVGTDSSWDCSGWRDRLDQVDPSFVRGALSAWVGGRWGLGLEQGWARVIQVWAVPALVWAVAVCLSPPRKGGYHLLGPGTSFPSGVSVPGPRSVECVW